MDIHETIAVLSVKDEAKVSDEIILRQAIIAELDAVNLYEQMAKSAKNARLKKILLDVANEEKVHVGEFQALLEELDKEHEPSVVKGKAEVGDFKEWFARRIFHTQSRV